MKSFLIFVSAIVYIGLVASRKYTFLTITYTVTRRERKRKKLNEKFVPKRKQYLRPNWEENVRIVWSEVVNLREYTVLSTSGLQQKPDYLDLGPKRSSLTVA